MLDKFIVHERARALAGITDVVKQLADFQERLAKVARGDAPPHVCNLGVLALATQDLARQFTSLEHVATVEHLVSVGRDAVVAERDALQVELGKAQVRALELQVDLDETGAQLSRLLASVLPKVEPGK